VLTCQHHIQWVRQVAGGLHQCILCTQVVTKKDIYPKLEDLPEEFRRRWEAHEATRPPAEPVSAEAAAKPKAPPPTASAGAPPRAPSAVSTPARAGSTPPAPIPRPSPAARSIAVPPAASHDPASGG
jgi:hypothetical protein